MKQRMATVGSGDKCHIIGGNRTSCGLKKNIQSLMHQSKPMCRNCQRVAAKKRRYDGEGNPRGHQCQLPAMPFQAGRW